MLTIEGSSEDQTLASPCTVRRNARQAAVRSTKLIISENPEFCITQQELRPV